MAQMAADAYAAADAVIRPAVFMATRRLGWDLQPSACTAHAHMCCRPGVITSTAAHTHSAASSSPAPVTAGLPFVDSPTGLVLCLSAYLVIVLLGLALQPRAAKAPAVKREDPLWLRLLVLGHNVFLVTLSLYMSVGCAPKLANGCNPQALLPLARQTQAAAPTLPCCEPVPPSRRSHCPRPSRRVARCALASGYKLWGVPYSPRETELAKMIHIFFVSKIYEFMDTFIMLLKGNVQQVRHRPSPMRITPPPRPPDAHVWRHAPRCLFCTCTTTPPSASSGG